MSEADLIAALEQYTKSNQELAKAEREKVEVLYKVVITGDPEKHEPGMLEIQRNHQKVIDNVAKASWVLVGAILVGAAGIVWQVVQHVSLAP